MRKINQAASLMGKRGGPRGGRARARSLTLAQRVEIARRGGRARARTARRRRGKFA